MLFRTLGGSVPYERTSAMETMLAHLYEPPPRLRTVAPDLPQALDDVLSRALAKDPGDRHASAGEFARAAVGAVLPD